MSFPFDSKLSVNPSWVKSVFSKQHKRRHSLERAIKEVKFFPSGEVRDKNPLWAWAVIFVTSAHVWPDVRKVMAASRAPCFKMTNWRNNDLWGRELTTCQGDFASKPMNLPEIDHNISPTCFIDSRSISTYPELFCACLGERSRALGNPGARLFKCSRLVHSSLHESGWTSSASGMWVGFYPVMLK